MKTIERGRLTEKHACEFLTEQGLKLVTSNYHSRFGEIDLIMTDDQVLVFIEVRYRRNKRFGGALSSITPAKQRKISLTAMQFLQKNNKTNAQCRFDVVALSHKLPSHKLPGHKTLDHKTTSQTTDYTKAGNKQPDHGLPQDCESTEIETVWIKSAFDATV